ncbi:MAG: serine/threonine protein kinase, partial [Acidobacteriia bacterium]|nr:serine/threonine protein kinase [Terriglobia bacterium]
MEFIDGENLRQRLSGGPMTLDDTINVALGVAAGLRAAHECGIVHRDIKPENVIFTRDGTPKIADFGLAVKMDPPAAAESETRPGTSRYMSPEQIRGERLSAATDIWSLGAVMFEMVAGRPPFSAEYEQAVFYSITNEEPPSVSSMRSDVPPLLGEIIHRCLEKSPMRRFPDAASLFAELERVKLLSKDHISRELTDLMSIDLANALLFVACGLTWSGARLFDG